MGDYFTARVKGQVHRLLVLGRFPRTEEHLSLGAVGTGRTESPGIGRRGSLCAWTIRDTDSKGTSGHMLV